MTREKGTIIHFNFTDIIVLRESKRERENVAVVGRARGRRRERSEMSQTRDCALADCSVLW